MNSIDDPADRFFVITGGPGSGKSTPLIAAWRDIFGQDAERKELRRGAADL